MTVDPQGCTAPEAHYLDGLRAGILRLQRCTESGAYLFYPRSISPWSGRQTLEWVDASGHGRIYSSTTVRRPAHRGGDYNVSLVDLEEGVRMMSSVVGIPPDAVQIGMAVQADFDPDPEMPRVLFRPAAEEKA